MSLPDRGHDTNLPKSAGDAFLCLLFDLPEGSPSHTRRPPGCVRDDLHEVLKSLDVGSVGDTLRAGKSGKDILETFARRIKLPGIAKGDAESAGNVLRHPVRCGAHCIRNFRGEPSLRGILENLRLPGLPH